MREGRIFSPFPFPALDHCRAGFGFPLFPPAGLALMMTGPCPAAVTELGELSLALTCSCARGHRHLSLLLPHCFNTGVRHQGPRNRKGDTFQVPEIENKYDLNECNSAIIMEH